ncbi:hypothetical protein [Methylobacter sp.]|uniref:hypothetical protein n=1 Tax=Methylobacter sp. TaxID=2051955 RepID=UPI001222556B|nr:hypothetical protein [Methylobacter sp.]TAK63799.1 MAG: hypothetical protein EPO18_05745 [Methylobacter sp.]
MTIYSQLIVCHDEQNNIKESAKSDMFLLSDSNAFNFTDDKLPNNLLKEFVLLITRKPKRLIAHIQRIYHCYQANLQEQLFAALVDLLVILNGRGKAISWRMITGTKSKLSDEQYKKLLKYMTENIDVALLAGNEYSVFTKGLIGTRNLVQQIEVPDEQEHDPLNLAYDYIEYSQLNEAKEVLEKAIVIQPQRLELHQCLLELYKSTFDSSGFTKMFNIVTTLDVVMPNDWNILQAFFNERNQ